MAKVVLATLTQPQWDIFRAGPNFVANDNSPVRLAVDNAVERAYGRKVKRFRVVVAGRRFGKTTLALTELIGTASRFDECEVWYIAPTYRQAKQIAWKMLKRMLPKGARKAMNESELSITLRNGSIVALKGADNADSLRGVGLRAAVLDEYASMNPEVWEEAIRPALADHQGWALFIGTPKGFNHFYDMFMKGNDPSLGVWESWQFTTEQGGNVLPEELEQARAEMDPRIYKQEFQASFENMQGRVYYNFDRAVHISEVEDSGGVLLVGMDFNVNPMSAVIATRHGDELHVWDEVELPNSNTQEMTDHIIAKWGKRGPTPDETRKMAATAAIIPPKSVFNRTIQVYPDPSGRSRKTSANLGETDFTILQRAGFKVVAPHAAPPVNDGINTVNAMLRTADGRVRVYIHPRCKRLIKCLDGLTFKDGTKLPDKSSGLDHLPDALRYLIMSEFPVLQARATSQEVRL